MAFALVADRGRHFWGGFDDPARRRRRRALCGGGAARGLAALGVGLFLVTTAPPASSRPGLQASIMACRLVPSLDARIPNRNSAPFIWRHVICTLSMQQKRPQWNDSWEDYRGRHGRLPAFACTSSAVDSAVVERMRRRPLQTSSASLSISSCTGMGYSPVKQAMHTLVLEILTARSSPSWLR